MSQDEIIVDFNVVKTMIKNNDAIEDVKPKAKRASKKNNIVNEESVEPVELKPKPKRASKKNIVIVESEPVEDYQVSNVAEQVPQGVTSEPVEESVEESVEPVEVKPKPKRASKKIIL